MKKFILLASFLLVQTAVAEPIVWNGKFYPDQQLAKKNRWIPTYSKPVRALAIEISKAQKYFIGPDALVWQKRNILKQQDQIQGQMLMAKQLDDSDAIVQYRTVQDALKLQLSWINEQISRFDGSSLHLQNLSGRTKT